MANCPCNSEKEYSQCCEPFHQETKKPETARELMQARYSAFVKEEIDFIASTHIPGTKDFNLEEAKEWAKSSTWKGLEIIKAEKGGEDHSEGLVEFKALYADSAGKDYLHHEIASFKKIKEKWYFEQGQIVGTGPIKRATPKIGRNDPCTCDSGKKYKKCCGAVA